MNVTFWLDGERVGAETVPHVQVAGDHVTLDAHSNSTYIVSERRAVRGGGWHIVLRRPETPAESTPPWKRKGEVKGWRCAKCRRGAAGPTGGSQLCPSCWADDGRQ